MYEYNEVDEKGKYRWVRHLGRRIKIYEHLGLYKSLEESGKFSKNDLEYAKKVIATHGNREIIVKPKQYRELCQKVLNLMISDDLVKDCLNYIKVGRTKYTILYKDGNDFDIRSVD